MRIKYSGYDARGTFRMGQTRLPEGKTLEDFTAERADWRGLIVANGDRQDWSEILWQEEDSGSRP